MNHININTLFSFHAHPWALAMLFPVILSTILALRTWSVKYSSQSHLFSILNWAIALWSLAYALELGHPSMEGKLFWLKIEYLAIPFVPVLWFMVVLENGGWERHLSKKNIQLLFILPVITFLLASTNPFHHLYYSQVSLNAEGSFPRLELVIGPWYVVNLAYAYLLTITSIFILGKNLLNRSATYWNQAVIFFSGALIPLLVSISYISKIFPVPNYDPLPFGFSISAAVIGYGIFKHKLFDLIPFARDHIFHSMADIALVIDQKKRLVECNASASKILIWDQAPLGKPIAESFPDNPFLEELINASGPEVKEISVSRNGKIHFFEVTRSDITNRKAEIIGHSFVFHDINNRKRTEEKLRALNAEKDKFFSIIAHDLRSPFNAFLGLSRILAEEIEGLSIKEIQSMADNMQQAASNLYRQLENLLEWSQFQRGIRILQPTQMDILRHTNSVMAFLQEAARQKEIRFSISIPPGLTLFADPQMMETLILNLASNAIKFSQRGGKISITAHSQANGLYYSVSDEGIGIPPQTIPKLFRIDEKVFQPGTEGEPSSGLGLLLCREIVEKHGGQIQVESQLGQGSTFSFIIPHSEPPE
jgi:PAS domain S-box-containing protein